MIQFNLLPDVKLEYLKTRHTKRLVTIISMIAAGVSLAVLIVLFLSVQVWQKKTLDDLSKDITKQEKTLNSVAELDKILTIQNQLQSLPDLHQNKPVTSRLFGYIQQVTPVQATISSLNVDLQTNTMTIGGTADSLVTINKFADTLKFATYKDKTTDQGKPFSNIVTTLARSDKGTSYTFSLNFEPALFQSDDERVLVVPNQVSTRSVTEKPEAIFKEDMTKTEKN